MELATQTRLMAARSKPLAVCLAAALALGAVPIAADERVPSKPSFDAGGLASSLQPSLVSGATAPSSHAPRALHLSPLRHPKPRPIPTLPANTVPVTNCNDSGAGSLRDALENVAVDGDTVDLSHLTCSTITLTSAPILFQQNSITLQGPGYNNLTLTGGVGSSRIPPLQHYGRGTLSINGMTVSGGAKYFDSNVGRPARGGCIYSHGSVSLADAEVKYCTAQNTDSSNGSYGGAVFAYDDVTLANSSIYDSSAEAPNNIAFGGAVYAYGSFTMLDSYIGTSRSHTSGGGAFFGFAADSSSVIKYSQMSYNTSLIGGAFYGAHDLMVEYSTISNNYGTVGAGASFGAATSPVTFLDSTISGNSAAQAAGGIFVEPNNPSTTHIYNCTIAFNTTRSPNASGAGIHAESSTIALQSTIVAHNTNDDGSGPVEDDIDGTDLTLTGANDLIMFSLVQRPPGTLSDDPQLQGLADNGGLTPTHALPITSPAINEGNDTSGVATDQRGSGFVRVSGGRADIGAFELDLEDVIFENGFDP